MNKPMPALTDTQPHANGVSANNTELERAQGQVRFADELELTIPDTDEADFTKTHSYGSNISTDSTDCEPVLTRRRSLPRAPTPHPRDFLGLFRNAEQSSESENVNKGDTSLTRNAGR